MRVMGEVRVDKLHPSELKGGGLININLCAVYSSQEIKGVVQIAHLLAININGSTLQSTMFGFFTATEAPTGLF